MNAKEQVAGEFPLGVESLVVVCVCTAGNSGAGTTTTAVAMLGGSSSHWLGELLDDWAIVAAVQHCLRRRMIRIPLTPREGQVLDWFYDRYCPVVRRAIVGAGHRIAPVAERDDFSQEVWREIVVQFQKLRGDHIRDGIPQWLTGLTRRTLCGFSRRRARRGIDRCMSLEGFEESLPSPALGPEDACHLGETWNQMEIALSRLRGRTSSTNYDIFYRRFFWGQNVKEIAAALGLNCHEVRCRYHRVKQKWQVVAKGLMTSVRTQKPLCRGSHKKYF